MLWTGIWIKRMRKHLGMTQKMFAAEMGISVNRLARIEHGEVEATDAEWRKIEKITGADRDMIRI